MDGINPVIKTEYRRAKSALGRLRRARRLLAGCGAEEKFALLAKIGEAEDDYSRALRAMLDAWNKEK